MHSLILERGRKSSSSKHSELFAVKLSHAKLSKSCGVALRTEAHHIQASLQRRIPGLKLHSAMEGSEFEESDGFLLVPRELANSQETFDNISHPNLESVVNIDSVAPWNANHNNEEWEKPEAPADEDPEEVPSMNNDSAIRHRRLVRMSVGQSTGSEPVRSMVWDASYTSAGDERRVSREDWAHVGDFWAFGEEQPGMYVP